MHEMQRVKDELYRLFQIEASPKEVAQIIRAFNGITHKVDSARIADAVCATFGIEMEDLRSKCRESHYQQQGKFLAIYAWFMQDWTKAKRLRL